MQHQKFRQSTTALTAKHLASKQAKKALKLVLSKVNTKSAKQNTKTGLEQEVNTGSAKQNTQTGLQGSKIALVRSYLRVPQAAGQVKNWIILVKTKLFSYMCKYLL